ALGGARLDQMLEHTRHLVLVRASCGMIAGPLSYRGELDPQAGQELGRLLSRVRRLLSQVHRLLSAVRRLFSGVCRLLPGVCRPEYRLAWSAVPGEAGTVTVTTTGPARIRVPGRARTVALAAAGIRVPHRRRHPGMPPGGTPVRDRRPVLLHQRDT